MRGEIGVTCARGSHAWLIRALVSLQCHCGLLETHNTTNDFNYPMGAGMSAASLKRASRVRLSGFDCIVFSGAAVNVLVIGYLIGHWLLAG